MLILDLCRVRALNTPEPSGEMSVGDVLMVGNTALACDAVGFREIPLS